jgi:hypothetical protein
MEKQTMPGMMSLMMRMMSKVMPNCHEASILTSRAMDEDISLKERVGLKMHLLVCKWCRRYSKQVNLIRDIVRRQASRVESTESQTDLNLSPGARNRIEKILKDGSRYLYRFFP